MFGGNVDSQTLIVVAAVFGLVGAGWFVVMIVWTMRHNAQIRKLQTRLGLLENDQVTTRTLKLWHDGQEITATVPYLDRRFGWFHRFLRLPQDAGWQMEGQAVYLAVLGAAAGVGLMVFALSFNWLAALGGVAATILVFWIYMKQRIARRISLFERQFIDALELIARSLRAGHPLLGAFQLVADEMGAPVSTVFTDMIQQQAMGMELSLAIRAVAADTSSPDLRLFATSVAIQLKTGGNLADMMDRLSAVIRERIRLGRRVRVLTVQTQFSKRILLVLPLFVFFLFQFLNDDYMEPLYTTTAGHWMLAIAVTAMIIGTWLMNRLARLEV